MSTPVPTTAGLPAWLSTWLSWLRSGVSRQSRLIETHQLRGVYRSYLIISPVSILAAVFLYTQAASIPPGNATLQWIVCVVIFHSLRLGLALTCVTQRDSVAQHRAAWRHLTNGLQFLEGLMIMVFAVHIWPLYPFVEQLVQLMTLMLVVTGTSFALAGRWLAIALYLPSTYLSFAWMSWQVDHIYARPITGVILLFFGLCVMLARNHHRANVMGLEQAERNGVLAQELQVKNTELQEVAAARSRLLATVSHDLRQPAHAIGLLCERALLDPSPSTVQVTLQDLHELSQSLSASLTTLMDLTRLDAGLVQVQASALPLSQVLMRLDAEFHASARHKGLQLHVPRTLLWVHSDPVLLHGVLANLVSNAIKYTREGRISLDLVETGRTVTVAVRDTGIGIHRDKLGVIFKEFVRLDASESGTEGLGLGLSIVRRYAGLLGHELHVESLPGRGSCFSIRLPVVPADRQVQQLMGAAHGLATRDARLHGVRVLVVDNVDLLLSSMVKTLSAWGCAVASARNMAEALAAADRQNFDVLISDFHLGDREPNGLMLIGALRQKQAAPLPALLMTGDVSSQLELDANRQQVRILHKPVRPAVLQNALFNLVPSAGQGARPAG